MIDNTHVVVLRGTGRDMVTLCDTKEKLKHVMLYQHGES